MSGLSPGSVVVITGASSSRCGRSAQSAATRRPGRGALRAHRRLGQLRRWIAYGRFEDVPGDVFRAVIETNLMGEVHAARAVLPEFRPQGGGVLVNMASVWGRFTSPDVSAYVTSKFAVRAFSECLRQELRDAPGIDVTVILPSPVTRRSSGKPRTTPGARSGRSPR